MMYKLVTFRIYDALLDAVYDFVGCFTTSAEILRFIRENEADGDHAYPVSFSYCVGYPFGV